MDASFSASSFTTSLSATRTQMDALMDTSQDFDTDPDGVVRWVASQSPIPALQALMKEAEREKRTRPSTPILTEPSSWTRSLTCTVSSTSLSASGGSLCHSNSNNSIDSSYLPLSGDSASTSSSSGFNSARRAKPIALAQRKPLSASTSSANQALRPSARPRSSSHSTSISNSKPVSKAKETSPEEETEAVAFLELLRDVSRQLDENSRKKQRLAARAKEKERERSLGRDGNDNRMRSDSSTRAVMKTSSASAISSVVPSGRTLERTSNASGSTSISAIKPESRPRVLTKTASLGAPGVHLVSSPVSLPSPNLAYNLNPEIPRVLGRTSSSSNIHRTRTRKSDTPVEPSSGDNDRDDNAMQGVVIDLTETDTEWDAGRNFRRTTSADTTMSVQVDDEDSDMEMDVSFYQPKPPPQLHFEPKPKPLPQPQTTRTTSRPPAPTQRRAGPPPLGMRRMPQSSQYSLSQAPKGVSVLRFKPPLLANANAGASKIGSGTKVVNTISTSKQPPRGGSTSREEETTQRARATGGTQDADSSFDVSFDVDGDALEEAMKAYD